MNKNLFQQLQEKRSKMKEFASAAFNKKWINEQEYAAIVEKIDNDVLTIGVIGQMKSGKSTFLNSLLFGREILPAATTPMTAALSVITYGEEERIEAEFYNNDEWKEMQMLSNCDITDANGDKNRESKIKAAKELVKNSEKISSTIPTLLGSTKQDLLSNLIDYVGAEGKYVSITKSVTIFHPTEWLKGVRIVDTPGFNDPVVSREERTQEFLESADVVVLLVYAGRAFDATDREIVFERVRNAGIGKVLIALNKYDMNFENGETIEEMIANVKIEIQKAVNESEDTKMKDLLEGIEPVPISANMALLAKLPMDAILNNVDKKHHWNRLTDIFEITTQAQMLEKSLVINLETAVLETVENDKMSLLIKKPVALIMQKGDFGKALIEKDLCERNELVKTLEKPDVEIKERMESLQKAQRRIVGKIEDALYDLETEYDSQIKKMCRKLEDEVALAKTTILRKVDNMSVFRPAKTQRIVAELITSQVEIAVNRNIIDSEDFLKKIIKIRAEDLGDEIKSVLNRYVKDSDDIVETFKRAVRKIKTENDEEYSDDFTESEEQGDSIWSVVGGVVVATVFAPIDLLFESAAWKEDLREELDNRFNSYNLQLHNVFQQFRNSKSQYIERFNGEALTCILGDLLLELDECSQSVEKKETKLKEAKEQQELLTNRKEQLQTQINEMQNLKIELAL